MYGVVRLPTVVELLAKARRHQDVVVGAYGHHEEVDDDRDAEVDTRVAGAVDEHQGDRPDGGEEAEADPGEEPERGHDGPQDEGQDAEDDDDGDREDDRHAVTERRANVDELGRRAAHEHLGPRH